MMPAPWRRGAYDQVDYVVVERDGTRDDGKSGSEEPTATINRMLRRSHARRQYPSPTDVDYESDDDEDDDIPSQTTISTMIPTIAIPSGPPAMLITMTLGQPQTTPTALADNDPAETVVIALPPPPRPHNDGRGHISQTTEHLLIAAGSIGATIIIVMIVLALYTMRKRGLTFSDVLQQGKQQMRRGPPPPISKYSQDQKQPIDDEYVYRKNDTIGAPPPPAFIARSGSLSSRTRLQALGRSDSFTQPPTSEGTKSFYDDVPSPSSKSHRRNDSATPSSPVLPIEGQRQSASTHNTRSLDGDEEALRYSDPPQEQTSNPIPAPPSFRQFLFNRPTISQRPGFGGATAGGMASRFSWTNSNAPQTPHDPSRDTVAQLIGRDSFMTTRSSVPRFRTIDSWVNQQSTRVEEQKLKQQFRMTQSTTYSDDEVPEMPKIPEIPKNASGITRQPSAAGLARNGSKSGLVGRDIKHQRHDTTTTVQTAPIFKVHPGTEVRFSTRSVVPSEILDMGRQNAAL